MNQNENHTPEAPIYWNNEESAAWQIGYEVGKTLNEKEIELLEAVAAAASEVYGHSAKKCGHEFECICPGDALRNALAALATHRKGGVE